MSWFNCCMESINWSKKTLETYENVEKMHEIIKTWKVNTSTYCKWSSECRWSWIRRLRLALNIRCPCDPSVSTASGTCSRGRRECRPLQRWKCWWKCHRTMSRCLALARSTPDHTWTYTALYSMIKRELHSLRFVLDLLCNKSCNKRATYPQHVVHCNYP